jgi:hypothetical protein
MLSKERLQRVPHCDDERIAQLIAYGRRAAWMNHRPSEENNSYLHERAERCESHRRRK